MKNVLCIKDLKIDDKLIVKNGEIYKIVEDNGLGIVIKAEGGKKQGFMKEGSDYVLVIN